MENNIENDVQVDKKRSLIQEFINSIKLKLEKEKILVIDRFEDDIAVCENRNTGEMLNIEKSKLPEDVKEKDVIILKNNNYEISKEEKEKIEDRIKNKVQNLFDD